MLFATLDVFLFFLIDLCLGKDFFWKFAQKWFSCIEQNDAFFWCVLENKSLNSRTHGLAVEVEGYQGNNSVASELFSIHSPCEKQCPELFMKINSLYSHVLWKI